MLPNFLREKDKKEHLYLYIPSLSDLGEFNKQYFLALKGAQEVQSDHLSDCIVLEL